MRRFKEKQVSAGETDSDAEPREEENPFVRRSSIARSPPRVRESTRAHRGESGDEQEVSEPTRKNTTMQKLTSVLKALADLVAKNKNTQVDIKQNVTKANALVARLVKETSATMVDKPKTATAVTQTTGTTTTACKETQTEELRLVELLKEIEEANTDESLQAVIGKPWPRQAFKQTGLSLGGPCAAGATDLAVFLREGEEEMSAGGPGQVKNGHPEMQILQINREATATPCLRKTTQVEEGPEAVTFLYKEHLGKKGDSLYWALLQATRRLIDTMKRKGRTSVHIPLPTGLETGRTRKVLEKAATGTGIQINLRAPLITATQDKETRATAPKKKRQREESLVVTKEGTQYADLLKQVKGQVAGQGACIRSVQKSEEGGVRILFEKGGGAAAVKERISKGLDKVTVRIHNTKHPMLIRDVDAVTTEREITDALKEVTGSEEWEVTRLRDAFAGTKVAHVRGTPEAVQKALACGRIEIGIVRCRVREPTEEACYRCLEKGHIARRCTGPDRSKICFRCGEEGHRAAECRSEEACRACKRRGHEIADCPNKNQNTAPQEEGDARNKDDGGKN